MDHGPLDLKDLSQEGNLNFVIVFVEMLLVLQQDQKDLLNLPLYRAIYFYIVMCSL